MPNYLAMVAGNNYTAKVKQCVSDFDANKSEEPEMLLSLPFLIDLSSAFRFNNTWKNSMILLVATYLIPLMSKADPPRDIR